VAATADQIKGTLDRYVEAFSAGDKQGYLSLFAPTATLEDPVGSAVCTGPDEIAGFWDGVRALTPSVVLERPGTPRIAGGELAVDLRAVAEIGDTKMVVDIIDVMTFDEEGRITSLRAFWDMAEMVPYTG
jgi:steroid Delta-isomerase